MDRITIENGMQDISSGTCIKFVPRTHEANFLDIQPRYGWVWLLREAFFFFFLHFLKLSVMVMHVISLLRLKLLVISGSNRRKPDPVTADSWVHVVRSGCPRVHARARLCTRAVSLRPRPLCLNCVEKHHTRFGSPPHIILHSESLFFTSPTLSFMFWQTKCTTSGNRWQTIWTVHMITALSCIMEGELLFEAT